MDEWLSGCDETKNIQQDLFCCTSVSKRFAFSAAESIQQHVVFKNCFSKKQEGRKEECVSQINDHLNLDDNIGQIENISGAFGLDLSGKGLENEDLMQYLTGGNGDSKIDAGSDSDDSSVDESQHFQQYAANVVVHNQLDNSVVLNHMAMHEKNNHSVDNLVFNNACDSSLFYNKGRLKWTPLMDKLLKEGVEKHSGHGVGMWKKVAEYVSINLGVKNDSQGNPVISNHQCGERYKHHLDPALDSRKAGPWTDEEVDNLRRLVAENTTHDEGSGKKPLINWVKIAIKLNRHYRDCQHKWINIVKAELKTGVFTKEEEDLILQRVHEWGDRGKGIWVTLEKELGRRNRSILDKYKRLVRKKTG